jgi:hypothetical protein
MKITLLLLLLSSTALASLVTPNERRIVRREATKVMLEHFGNESYTPSLGTVNVEARNGDVVEVSIWYNDPIGSPYATIYECNFAYDFSRRQRVGRATCKLIGTPSQRD